MGDLIDKTKNHTNLYNKIFEKEREKTNKSDGRIQMNFINLSYYFSEHTLFERSVVESYTLIFVGYLLEK